jgi:hypothetical protein
VEDVHEHVSMWGRARAAQKILDVGSISPQKVSMIMSDYGPFATIRE